jgi:hypothetical protein
MQDREMVYCLNPRLVTGRLYALTERGRDEVHAAFGVVVAVPPQHMWIGEIFLGRARQNPPVDPRSVGSIRIQYRHFANRYEPSVSFFVTDHAVGLNPVIRAIKDLVWLGLVQQDGVTDGARLQTISPDADGINSSIKHRKNFASAECRKDSIIVCVGPAEIWPATRIIGFKSSVLHP